MLTFDDISLLRVTDLTCLTGLVVIIITSLVQAFSKRFSPWTWVLVQIGKIINNESLEKLQEIDDKVISLEKWNAKQDEELELTKVLAARRRILLCADEISHQPDILHTHEYFDEILSDVKMYKQYCKEHPDFENEKAVVSMQIVTETYNKCFREGNFL